MKNKSLLHRVILQVNIYSFDVVIGSIMMGLFAARILDVQDSIWWYFILALSVWVMYTTDHLLDAVKGKENSTFERHTMHYRYRKKIIPIWIVAAVLAGIIALYELDLEIVYNGLLLGLVVGAYFLFLFYNRQRHPWLLQKELIIAFIYVGGIWLAPLVWYATVPPISILMIVANMILLAWTEGVLVSWFEQNEDLLNHHSSFTTLFGKRAAKSFVLILLVLAVITAIFCLLFCPIVITLKAAFVVQILMAFTLAILLLFPVRFRQNQLYRYIGEITFWFPGLILLV